MFGLFGIMNPILSTSQNREMFKLVQEDVNSDTYSYNAHEITITNTCLFNFDPNPTFI